MLITLLSLMPGLGGYVSDEEEQESDRKATTKAAGEESNTGQNRPIHGARLSHQSKKISMNHS
jgi:hypothetical protein